MDDWKENFATLLHLIDNNTVDSKLFKFKVFASMNNSNSDNNLEIEITDCNQLQKCFDNTNNNKRECTIRFEEKTENNHNNKSNNFGNATTDDTEQLVKYFLVTSSGQGYPSFKWVPSFASSGNQEHKTESGNEMKINENSCDWDEELNDLKHTIYNRYHLYNAPKLEIKGNDDDIQYGNDLENLWDEINDELESTTGKTEYFATISVGWQFDKNRNDSTTVERELMDIGYKLRSIIGQMETVRDDHYNNRNLIKISRDVFRALKSLKDEIMIIANDDEYDESSLDDCLSEFGKWMSFVSKEYFGYLLSVFLFFCFLVLFFFFLFGINSVSYVIGQPK